MDALRFGRWLSERRRSHGWPSQQACAQAATADERLCGLGISEAFLARLEAGLLAYPFRGAVRGRVLGLAWLLCSTPRELSAFLRGAGLTDLSRAEADEVAAVRASLDAQRRRVPLLLPARPRELFGRGEALVELLNALQSGRSGLYVVTGAPGAGKSAIALSAVHEIAANDRARTRLFPDGIVTLSCTGRQGAAGLAALLDECCALFAPARDLPPSPAPVLSERAEVVDIAHTINRARSALAGKRILLLLDNVEPDFPLRTLLDSVLVGGYEGAQAAGSRASRPGRPGQVVLATTCFTPVSVLPAHRLDLPPLAEEDAVRMLSALIGRPLEGLERRAAAEVCAAAAYLPLAIEIAASAIVTSGIHLPTLAHRLVSAARGAAHALTPRPLDQEALHAMLLQTLRSYATLAPRTREHFAWLAGLGAREITQRTEWQPALAGGLRSNAS